MAGITLGVMMVVAVDLATSSARRAFELSVDTITGNITHQIVAANGLVDDAVFAGLRRETGIRRSAPMVSGEVLISGESFTLLGLDLISEMSLQRQRPGFSMAPYQMLGLGAGALTGQGAVFLQEAAALGLGLEAEDSFEIRASTTTFPARLAGVLSGPRSSAAEGVVFADIATAQLVLDKQGLDSIDLILEESQADQIRNWLPDGLILVDALNRNASIEQFSAAFALNLSAMSLLALLVAALLIYNTVSLSVLERNRSFGILRSLGTEPAELVRLVLAEAFVMGATASVTGVLLGLGLGQFLVKLVTRTIDDLYFNLTVSAFMPDPLLLLKGLLWGTGITVLAAWLPALQAGKAIPVTLQQRMQPTEESSRHTGIFLLAGVLMLVAGYGLLAVESSSLLLGFVALNLIIFGFCLGVPWLVMLFLDCWLRLAGRYMKHVHRLGIRNLRLSINRTGLAIAALTVAVSVTVGVGVMVGSFRQTIVLWLDQTLGGDIQITRLDQGGGMPAELIANISALPGVTASEVMYSLDVETTIGQMQVLAHEGDIMSHLYMKEAVPDAVGILDSGRGVLLAEPTAWLFKLAPGDSIELYTASGSREFEIAGIFHDYTTSGGSLAMSLSLLESLWPSQLPMRLTLKLEDGVNLREIQSRARNLTEGGDGLFGVAANADIRNITLVIFDRTFAITGVLRILAIVVAFVGILSALMALQMQRMREYALLRAGGMTSAETTHMILLQTAVMGLLAGLLSMPLGLMMSDILIDVINRRSFGWSMQHILPAGVLAEAIVLSLVAAVIAGLYPCRQVARLNPSLALRAE